MKAKPRIPFRGPLRASEVPLHVSVSPVVWVNGLPQRLNASPETLNEQSKMRTARILVKR